MQKVSVFSLRPGQKIARTVFSSMGEKLLEAGVILSPRYIQNLIKIGIPTVYIDDGLLKDIVVEEPVSREIRTAAVQQVKNILLKTEESGRLVIEPKSVYSTVSSFTDELLSKQSLMVNLTDLRSQDDYTFAHSVNVCILALMTGISLGYDKEQLQNLGIGALLHDLGKIKIPSKILNKPNVLSPEEWLIMKRHPIFSYNLIKDARGLSHEQAIIALQHHECYDGSGYPMAISKDNFAESSQIVAIADKFDALTANRIYRKAYPPHEAYELCAASGNYLFKDNIVNAFLYNIAAYPIGSLVQLNNERIAVVTKTPKGFSRFPNVRVLFDRDYQPLPSPEELVLSETVGVSVVRVLDESEINLILNKSINKPKD